MRGRFAVVGRDTALQAVTLPPSRMAIAVNADAHEEVGAMLDTLGVGSLVMRPDFYCFGAQTSDSGEALTTLVNALKEQLEYGDR